MLTSAILRQAIGQDEVQEVGNMPACILKEAGYKWIVFSAYKGSVSCLLTSSTSTWKLTLEGIVMVNLIFSLETINFNDFQIGLLLK